MKYSELKEYCDKFNNYILNTIYDSHIMIEEYSINNQIKYKSNIDTLLSILKDLDNKMEYNKILIETDIKSLKTKLNQMQRFDIIYLEVVKELRQINSFGEISDLYLPDDIEMISMGDITWANKYYENDVNNGGVVHIEDNKYYNNFDGSCFRIVGYKDVDYDEIKKIEEDISLLEYELSNIMYKYLDHIEDFLYDYLDKLDIQEVDDVDITYDKTLLKQSMNTKMLKI